MWVGPVQGERTRGTWWVRVFGYGVSVVDSRRYPPLFSERNGYVRVWYLGPWRVRYLRPTP